MDQLPRSHEGFANRNLFADSQQYNAYDLFHPGADQNSYDASWGIHASNYNPAPSRVQQPHGSTPSWPQQHANHLPAPSAHNNLNGQASPYARSLSHSPAPYGQNAFNGFGAPQNFQYRQPQYDPALVAPHAFGQNFNYATTEYEVPNSGTIAPQALEHETRSPAFARNPYDGSAFASNNAGHPRSTRPLASEFIDQAALTSAIPKGKNAGYFSIIDFGDLAKATTSERMGNFVNIGTETHNWDVNRAALPSYVQRKSRKELRKTAGNDPKLLAKLGKKAKKENALAAASKKLQSSTTASDPNLEKIKYEGDSSSNEESSSDDDEGSSYTSDDDTEASPLPDKRPENPKGATEYDTIKALWRSRRKNVDPDSIRKALGGFWEIVKTIRDRWKADVAALTDAESKNRTNELPLLKSRVKDQRDMLESAFKAALKHGHRNIVELLGENVSLIFLCYQFLLDRAKVDDYNSSLPRVILEIMALFTTITDDKLEKTHLVKVLPRYIKKGDAKTQFYAKRITSNAAAASKEKTDESPAKKSITKETNAPSPTTKRTEPEPVAGVKRPASAAGDGGVQKKIATAASKANGVSTTTKLNGAVKKPASSTESAKPNATATSVKPKQVVAKPSGLFSSLQSAAKKPGTSNASKVGQSGTAGAISKSAEKSATSSAPANQPSAPRPTFSFAEAVATLTKPKEEKPAPKPEKEMPQETAEEKAKRLRKEARRQLHVSFKTGEDLVQVHVFDHDPEEEQRDDANQVRDLADVGGEGRMFKQQHQLMDIDDEEEAAEEAEALLEFKAPTLIDFSVIDSEERKRNYAPFGGGENQPESAERAVREKHEASTLIVFYAEAKDVPPNPREPSDPHNGENTGTVKKLGAPDEKWVTRARQKKSGHSQQYIAPQQPTMQINPAPSIDLSKLSTFMNNQQYSQPTSYQPQPTANDAINNILATLKQAAPSQVTPPPPVMSGYGNQFSAAPPNMMPTQQPATQPTSQPDLAAILAQITQNQPSAAPAPPMGGYGYGVPSAVPNMTYQPQMQQATVFENPERKQWREGGGDGTARNKRQNQAQNPYYRTKVCKYWQEGRCQKGDQCSYKHEEA